MSIDERLEGVKMFLENAGMDGDDLLQNDAQFDDFMSFDNKQNIDYDEMPTDLQIKDGVNRIKQLALKIGAYMHVKHHEPVPWMFQEQVDKAPVFHLKE